MSPDVRKDVGALFVFGYPQVFCNNLSTRPTNLEQGKSASTLIRFANLTVCCAQLLYAVGLARLVLLAQNPRCSRPSGNLLSKLSFTQALLRILVGA